MKRFAYALLAAIWIAGIWIWLHPLPDPPAARPLEPAAAADAHSSPAAEPARKPSPPIAAPRHRQRAGQGEIAQRNEFVHVRSSVGLPLLWVEVSVAGEAWQSVDLPTEGLEVEPEAWPLRVRAAGHLEADGQRGAGEIVLEPDGLLSVESANLRTRARELAVLEGAGIPPRHSGVLAEFPDAGRLLVAFSPARLASLHPGDIDVCFVCPDGREIRIAIRPIPGLRARYALAPDDLRGTAPLEVEVVEGDRKPVRAHLWLRMIDPVQKSGAQHDFSWGSVSIGEPRAPEFPDPIWNKARAARIEALALDRRFALCALDEHGNHARIEFVHDGSPRRIVLQAPFVVAGRAVDAQSGAGLVWPDVRAYPAGEPDHPDWFVRDGPSDEVGGFELDLPGARWGTENGSPPLEPPEKFTLVVSAVGHRSKEVEFAWSGRRRVEVGTIALEPSAGGIAIDTSDMLLAPWTDLSGFTFGDEPAIEWTVRHVVSRTNGLQELELDFDGSGAKAACRMLVNGEMTSLPFPGGRSELLLLRARDEAFAFRRGAGGTYELVRRTAHVVVVQCDRLPERGSWTLGWRGGGTWAGFRTVSRRGTAAEWLLLPDFATELWWSVGEAPPDLCKQAGGSLKLGSDEQTLVLR